jgi:hypothetical protein
VFAKLDRLTRNLGVLRSLVASDVDLVFLVFLVFCDWPHGEVLAHSNSCCG